MAVSGDNVKGNGKELGAYALELVVAMDITNGETAGRITSEHVAEAAEDGGTRAIGDRVSCAIADVSRDRVEKRETLHEKEIGADRDVGVMLKDRGGNGLSHERGRAWCSSGTCGLALGGRNFGAVDNGGPTGIVRCHGTVLDEVLGEVRQEIGLRGPAKFAIQFTCSVGGLDVTRGEQFPLFSYCGKKAVSGNRVVSRVTFKNI